MCNVSLWLLSRGEHRKISHRFFSLLKASGTERRQAETALNMNYEESLLFSNVCVANVPRSEGICHPLHDWLILL